MMSPRSPSKCKSAGMEAVPTATEAATATATATESDLVIEIKSTIDEEDELEDHDHENENERSLHPHQYQHQRSNIQNEIIPFGEEDVNLWAIADPTAPGVELQLHHQEHHQQQQTPKDELDLEATDSETTIGTVPPSSDTHTKTKVGACLYSLVEVFKYSYSTVLLLFCIVMISAAIWTRQTVATGPDFALHPAPAFLIFWFLILWLSLMEGGLNCMVGLQSLKPKDYQNIPHSHPITYRSTRKVHKHENMERFIVGRQYLDLSCIFLTNFMVSTLPQANVLGLPQPVCDFFFNTGFAVILITIVIGQLVTQINSSHSMLDFTNNYAMLAVAHISLFVESTGLLHSVYLIQRIFAKCTGNSTTENYTSTGTGAGTTTAPSSSTTTTTTKVLYWLRLVISTAIILLSLAIIVVALFTEQTTMWQGVPAYASIILMVVLILVTGMMEGLQIAFFAVVHWPDEDIAARSSIALQNCQLVLSRKKNLQTFLIGRQILQTVVMFFLARMTTLQVNNESTFMGVSPWIQTFLNTGVLQALFSTVIASLSWRVIASTFPMAFLSNPVSNIIIRLCLFVEKTGVCYSAWPVSAMERKLIGYRPDEEHFAKNNKQWFEQEQHEKQKQQQQQQHQNEDHTLELEEEETDLTLH